MELLAHVDEGKRRFVLASRDPGKRKEFLAVADWLRQAIAPEAEYSGEMRFLMRGERSKDHPWIQELLEA